MVDLVKIEKKWQDRWERARIFEVNADLTKKKIFITVPYPYTSGVLHIGHGRSYVNSDIFARYYRAKGYNVLFPMAFHITGTPVLAILSSIKRGDMKTIKKMEEYVALHVKKKEDIKRIVKSFENPWNLVRYFSEKMKFDFKSIGMSFDWTREFTTGDEIYNKFIEWQYLKLKEAGCLEKGEYPILYCPRCDNAVGEDDIIGGDELNLDIVKYYCLKFSHEDVFIIASTLRPETIFGITNLWINSNENYVKVLVNGEAWIISEKAVETLKYQNKSVKIIKKFKGDHLIGKKVRGIIDNQELIILPADFVNPEIATGIVYSVPAHAPYDYIALRDIQENQSFLEKFQINEPEISAIKPIKIIDLRQINEYPSQHYCNKYKISSIRDKQALELATAENYKNEYYNGILNDKCGKYGGKKVKDVIPVIIEELKKSNKIDFLYMLNVKDVKCKCGKKIIISILKDQWFLNYNSGNWKEKALKCLNQLKIVPYKYKTNFINNFNWLEKRPCARKRGLGTPFPFDKGWIIEPLSDSTIYMAFYTISKILKENNIQPKQLSPEVFDFIFLKKGNIDEISSNNNIDKNLLNKMQLEFHYWYPVDHRHTAIMHISNHLSFYIFHHVAIFPEKYWPKLITLVEPVIREGQKMGKSKGNVIPLAEIQNKYSADLFRFYISHGADLQMQVNWQEDKIQSVNKHILKFYNFMKENIEKIKDFSKDIKDLKNHYPRAILSRIIGNFFQADKHLSEFNIRKYLQVAFYENFKLLQELKMFSKEKEVDFLIVFKEIYQEWLKMLSLAIPHVCEELWELAGNKNFISTEKWTSFNKSLINQSLEYELEQVEKIIEDILKIKEMVGLRKAKKIFIYTAPKWMNEIFNEIHENKINSKQIQKLIKKYERLNSKNKVVSYIQEQIKKKIWEKQFPKLDDSILLERYKNYIEMKVGCKIIINSDFDPKNKSSKARPFKPAIYFDI
ncbi:MAG: leucine--tRNA ligase [Promethearchaeota archaeon]